MPDTKSTTQKEELPPRNHRRSRTRRIVAERIILFLAVIITGCITEYRIVDISRFKMLSQPDANSGLRIEYSVSNHYVRHIWDLTIKLPYPESREIWVYDLRPPSAVARWLNRFILRRTPPPDIPVPFGPDSITAVYWREFVDEFPQASVDGNGFPIFVSKQALRASIVQDHELIHGCPVTWCSIDWGNIGSAKSHHYQYYVVARPKRQSKMYLFVAESYGSTDRTKVRAEMLAIRNSIRIVKGK